MACGTPVAAFARGAPAGDRRRRRRARWSPPGDVAGLAAADPRGRGAATAAASARHAVERCSLARMVDGYERLYRAARRSARPRDRLLRPPPRQRPPAPRAAPSAAAPRAAPVTGLSSLPRPGGWAGDWLALAARRPRRRRPRTPTAAGTCTGCRSDDAGLRDRAAARVAPGSPTSRPPAAGRRRVGRGRRCWPGCTASRWSSWRMPGDAATGRTCSGYGVAERSWRRLAARPRRDAGPATCAPPTDAAAPVGGAVPLPGRARRARAARVRRRVVGAAGRRRRHGRDRRQLARRAGADARLGVDRARPAPGDLDRRPVRRDLRRRRRGHARRAERPRRGGRGPAARRRDPAATARTTSSAPRPRVLRRRRPGRSVVRAAVPAPAGRSCSSGRAPRRLRLGAAGATGTRPPASPTCSAELPRRARRRRRTRVVTHRRGHASPTAGTTTCACQHALAGAGSAPARPLRRRGDGRPRGCAPGAPAAPACRRRSSRSTPIPAACRWPRPATPAPRAALERAPTCWSSSTSTASPAPALVAAYADAVGERRPDVVWSRPGDLPAARAPGRLRPRATWTACDDPHPARPGAGAGRRSTLGGDPDLFWSLSFAVHRDAWRGPAGSTRSTSATAARTPTSRQRAAAARRSSWAGWAARGPTTSTTPSRRPAGASTWTAILRNGARVPAPLGLLADGRLARGRSSASVW